VAPPADLFAARRGGHRRGAEVAVQADLKVGLYMKTSELRVEREPKKGRVREDPPWKMPEAPEPGAWRRQYIPPMPPPPGIAGASFLSSGISETSASVVSRSDAIDEAFCSALRTTLAGSMTPAFTRSS